MTDMAVTCYADQAICYLQLSLYYAYLTAFQPCFEHK